MKPSLWKTTTVALLTSLWSVSAYALDYEITITRTALQDGYIALTLWPGDTLPPQETTDYFLREYPQQDHPIYRDILEVIRTAGGQVLSGIDDIPVQNAGRIVSLGGQGTPLQFTPSTKEFAVEEFLRFADEFLPHQYTDSTLLQSESEALTELFPLQKDTSLTSHGLTWVGRYNQESPLTVRVSSRTGLTHHEDRIEIDTADRSTLRPEYTRELKQTWRLQKYGESALVQQWIAWRTWLLWFGLMLLVLWLWASTKDKHHPQHNPTVRDESVPLRFLHSATKEKNSE